MTGVSSNRADPGTVFSNSALSSFQFASSILGSVMVSSSRCLKRSRLVTSRKCRRSDTSLWMYLRRKICNDGQWMSRNRPKTVKSCPFSLVFSLGSSITSKVWRLRRLDSHDAGEAISDQILTGLRPLPQTYCLRAHPSGGGLMERWRRFGKAACTEGDKLPRTWSIISAVECRER